MACNTVITASNGMKLRPMVESDFNFYMECWKDFPQGIQTFSERMNRFSAHMQRNEGYGSEALIKSGDVDFEDKCIVWSMILEKADGTPVAYQAYVFEQENECYLKFGMVHPSHRGQGYWTATHMFVLAMCERVEVTSAHSWFMASNPINSNAMTAERNRYAAAGFDISGTGRTTVTNPPMFNITEHDLVKNHGTIAQYTQYKANDSNWADITWTYSTT